MLTITHWSGRLGNNIFQLLNALAYCEAVGGTLTVLPEYPPLIKSAPRRFEFGQNGPAARGAFFDKQQLPLLQSGDRLAYNSINRLSAGNHLKAAVLAELGPLTPLDDRTVVVHMRSGDCFQRPQSHHYVQPPLAYYRRICSNYERVIIVTERDRRNPCIAALKACHPNCTVQSSDLYSDIRLMLSARNLVIGRGTFGPALIFCHPDNLKNVYIPEPLINNFGETPFQVHAYRFENYLDHWDNTPDHYRLMLELPDDCVVEV